MGLDRPKKIMSTVVDSSKWKDLSAQESLDNNEVCNTFCSFVYDNVADCSSCMLARQLFETHVTKNTADVIEIYVDEELRYFRFDAIVDALVKTNEFYENSDCKPVNIVFHAVKLDRTYSYGNAIWRCVKNEYSTPICDITISLPDGRLTKDDCLQKLEPVIQSVFQNI